MWNSGFPLAPLYLYVQPAYFLTPTLPPTPPFETSPKKPQEFETVDLLS